MARSFGAAIAQVVTNRHALGKRLVHALTRGNVRVTSGHDDGVRVYVVRAARTSLAKLSPTRRAALTAGFGRVGNELLQSAHQIEVDASWRRHTWPRRRYPQQCYAKTTKFMLQHLEIAGARLVHGVIA